MTHPLPDPRLARARRVLCMAALAALTACATAPAPRVVYMNPPPPVAEVVPPAPAVGWHWVPGHWYWADGRWRWAAGHYVQAVVPAMPAPVYEPVPPAPAPAPSYVWVRGHWRWSGSGWVWTRGAWVLR